MNKSNYVLKLNLFYDNLICSTLLYIFISIKSILEEKEYFYDNTIYVLGVIDTIMISTGLIFTLILYFFINPSIRNLSISKIMVFLTTLILTLGLYFELKEPFFYYSISFFISIFQSMMWYTIYCVFEDKCYTNDKDAWKLSIFDSFGPILSRLITISIFHIFNDKHIFMVPLTFILLHSISIVSDIFRHLSCYKFIHGKYIANYNVKENLKDFVSIFGDKFLLIFFLGCFLSGIIPEGLSYWISIYFNRIHDIPHNTSSIYSIIFDIGTFVATLFMSVYSYENFYITIFCTLILFGMFVFLSIEDINLNVSITIFALVGFISGLVQYYFISVLSYKYCRYVGSPSTLIVICDTMASLGIVIFSPVLTHIIDSLSKIDYLFYINTFISFFMFIVLLLIKRYEKKYLD